MLGPQRKTNPAPELPAIERAPLVPRLLDRASGHNAEPAQPLAADSPRDEKSAAKDVLAANLEGMIEGMLRSTQFATGATTKTRGWAQQIGEAAALDASIDDNAFSASSLIADLAQARGTADVTKVRPAAPRRWWVDAILALACLLGVASAAYLSFAT